MRKIILIILLMTACKSERYIASDRTLTYGVTYDTTIMRNDSTFTIQHTETEAKKEEDLKTFVMLIVTGVITLAVLVATLIYK